MQTDVVAQPLDRVARRDLPGFREHAPPLSVGGQGLDRPPGAVERDHQLHPQPLAEGETVDEPLQLRYECRALPELELRGEQLLERTHVELLETPDLGLRERLVPNVDEG